MKSRIIEFIRLYKIKFLRKQNKLVTELLKWYDPEYLEQIPHPDNLITLNEFHDIRYDSIAQEQIKLQIHKNNLLRLKREVKQTVSINNGRLTMKQIMELCSLKKNIRKYETNSNN